MFEMARAYEKGISPYHFRKSYSDDIDFVMDLNNARNEKIKLRKHQQKVKAAMENLKKW